MVFLCGTTQLGVIGFLNYEKQHFTGGLVESGMVSLISEYGNREYMDLYLSTKLQKKKSIHCMSSVYMVLSVNCFITDHKSQLSTYWLYESLEWFKVAMQWKLKKNCISIHTKNRLIHNKSTV